MGIHSFRSHEEVQVAPSSRLTTFGVGMCVEEKDGFWTNVAPLGIFLESGYEEDRHGRIAPSMLPDYGLDMYISGAGPLTGKRGGDALRVDSLFSISLVLNVTLDVIRMQMLRCPPSSVKQFRPTSIYKERTRFVLLTRIAGHFAANVLNCLATQPGLHFGGYGLTAVYNDSADIAGGYCMAKTPSIYPMTSIGQCLFAQRTTIYMLLEDCVTT